ncbi:MAG: DUF4358 domain-containing protein [Oscillospiraceae bacterium]|nr:DUF4358 domain-containing protein [Oscillospiraceae bacterium]
MTKKHIALIAVILSLSLLAACGGKTAEIRDDVAVSDVSAAVSSVLGDDTLVAVPETYYAGSMKMDVSEFDGYDVRINSKGINIDEFGVFKAKDSSQVPAVEQAVNDYLQLRLKTWMEEYMPEEKPKLENAEVRTVGNYVMYAILSDDDKSEAFDAFNKSLTK